MRTFSSFFTILAAVSWFAVACSDAADSGPIATTAGDVLASDDAAVSAGADADALADAVDAEPATTDAAVADVGPADVAAVEVAPADVAPDVVAPADVAAADVPPSDVKAADSAAADVPAIDVGNLADGATDGLTCTQIGQCAQDECNAQKLLCGLDCGAGATPAVTQKANDLLTCLTSTCLNKICAGNVNAGCMNPCAVTFCGSPMATCFSTGQNGGDACSTIFGCFKACQSAGTDVFTCESSCYNSLNAAAQGQLADFFACSKGANSTADALNLCAPQVLACSADGKSGSGTCLDLTTCAAKCAANDNTCSGACYGSAAVDAQTTYVSLASCFVTNSANPGACMPQAEACANPSGSDKCANILTCIGNCQTALGTTNDNGACAMQCMHTMSKPSADDAMSVLQCASAKCPGCLTKDPNCQSCATTNCGSEILACYLN